jgi:hypothetical protein
MVTLLYWNYTSKQIEETKRINDMMNKLLLASEAWFKEGNPIYWDPSNVKEIGLRSGNYLNWTKMSYLSEIGYQKVLSLLSLNYNLWYRVRNDENLTVFEFGVYPSNAKNAMKSERIAILNRTPVIIETVIWI